MSEIRSLLAAAQQAEMKGDTGESARLLREAAAWYRDHENPRRAAQMLRHARRVEGLDDEAPAGDAVFGFGREFEQEVAQLRPAGEGGEGTGQVEEGAPLRSDGKVLIERRGPQLADPTLDAWCSFCCRPKEEVGPLAAGPAGAFVCCDCLSRAAVILDHALPPRAPAPPASEKPWQVTALPFELRAQLRARTRFTRARSRLALVIGPEGAGKSAWLRSLGSQPDLRRVELHEPLTPEEEEALLRWLEAPGRAIFLELRAPVPPASLILQGEHGEEPLHDTASLVEAVPQLSPALLARVDAVMTFDSPSPAELGGLAQALAAARGVGLPAPLIGRLVELAERAGRGAHELTTLIARIPPGKYGE